MKTRLPSTQWLFRFCLLLSIICLLPSALAARPLTDMSITDGFSVRGEMDLEDGRPSGSDARRILFDEGPKGTPLAVGEVTFETGLYLLDAKVGWTYRLDDRFLSLFFVLGNPSDSKDRATLRIVGDDALLYQSDILEPGETVPVLIDLRGINELRLTTERRRGRNGHLVLGNARLTERNGGPAMMGAPSEGQPGNQLPDVRVSAAPEKGAAPLEVAFNSTASTDPDGKIMRYTWFFGDGARDTLNFNPTHTYDTPGIYEVAVIAEDDAGGQGVGRAVVFVEATANQRPVARTRVEPRLIAPGGSITFDAGFSFDNDGRIVNATWTFPDGTSREGLKATEVFPEAGIYSVRLDLEDDDGGITTVTERVRVDDGSNSTVFPLREGSRILFIGNSLLGGIGDALKYFASVSEPAFTYESGGAGKGAGNVEQYATQPELSVKAIIDEGWDIVVIQPWGRPYEENHEEVFQPYARTLVEWIRESGAYPIFLEPHVGYWNLDEQQKLGPVRIGQFADEVGAGYIPAGQAWLEVFNDYPAPRGGRLNRLYDGPETDVVDLLYRDNVHQNDLGSYLNALVIWHYLTGQSPLGIELPESVEDFEDRSMKRKYKDMDQLRYLHQAAARVSRPAEPLREND